MFYNRKEAGMLLAERLEKYRNLHPVVLAIPRGGLVLGDEIAGHLGAPLDVIITKKIGHPMNSEYAVGAASAAAYFLTPAAAGIPEEDLAPAIEKAQEIVQERDMQYHSDRQPIILKDRWTILVDDGIATGSTMELTVNTVKKQEPAGIVVALPVAHPLSLARLEKIEGVNEVVCLLSPADFRGVGQFYALFEQVSDKEAIGILQKARQREDQKFKK